MVNENSMKSPQLLKQRSTSKTLTPHKTPDQKSEEKIKKSPRYIVRGLERIFVVIEITKCVAFIFGCDWLDVKTFWAVLLFNSSPQNYSKSNHIKYILKSFIFVFFGASADLVLDLILKISSNNFSPKITLNLHTSYC
jgi:hypothetical protein